MSQPTSQSLLAFLLLFPMPSWKLIHQPAVIMQSAPCQKYWLQPKKILAKLFLLWLRSRCYFLEDRVFLSTRIPLFNGSLITTKGSSFLIHLPLRRRLILVPWRQLINYLMFVCIFTNIRTNLHRGTSHPYSMCHNYCFAISHQQKFIKTSRLINSKWS